MKLRTTLLALAVLGHAIAGAGDKEAGIDAATEIIAAWKQMKTEEIEARISKLSDVDALRTIAFFGLGAAYPQNAEDAEIDARLTRMFWMSIRALQKQKTQQAEAALRCIERSNLLQGGDLLLLRELSAQTKEGSSDHGANKK
jgi:uncharacterized membrane-anchored protein